MKKSILFVLVLLMFLCLAVSFSGCKVEDDGIRVMISLGEGASVIGDNPVSVSSGESVSFSIKIEEGYVFKSCEGASYDSESGILTVENVTRDTNVDFITEKSAGNGKEYTFFFKGASKDTSSVKPGKTVLDGSYVALSSKDESRVFVGWSLNEAYSAGGIIISDDRDYSLLISEDNAVDGKIFVYANYVDANLLYYDANGGQINMNSDNINRGRDSGKSHYSVTKEDGRLKVTYDNKYLSYMECASSFYDDGSFYRDGYVLIEYNTAADGSGESYSIGSKIPLISDGAHPVLYCIWAEDSDHSLFTYDDVSFNYPAGVNAAKAPHWVKDGVIITSYLGDELTVVIPEKIDGKYVTAIAEGAFVNKRVKTLVLNRRILKVEDGAFKRCSLLETIYYPDGIYSIGNGAFDSEAYKSLKHLYVNATLAPRYMGAENGAFATKISRLLSSENRNRVIVIGGSSVYQGLGTEYMEALFDGKYRVINFGTTRTTNGLIYLDAMAELAHEGDVVVFSPENSAYMMGETELYWKTLRDLESINNIFRHVDISNYSNVFGAFGDFNKNYRYTRGARFYEEVCEIKGTDKYGDCTYENRKRYFNEGNGYADVYYISMNERFKSRFDLDWKDEGQHDHADFTNESDPTWCSVDDPYYKDQMNRSISLVKSKGIKVYFGFCPTDSSSLVEVADSRSWLLDYDDFIKKNYAFDGVLGSCIDYIYDHKYFYDCAFHPNDYGRTYRTYQLYLDLVGVLGFDDVSEFDGHGTSFSGCLFESESDGKPLTEWQPSNP